ESRQQEGRGHLDELGAQEDPPAVEPVGKYAAEEREQEERRVAQERVEAQPEGRARHREDQPVLGDLLHPGADRGREGPRPHEAKVGVCERLEGPRQPVSHGARRLYSRRARDPEPEPRGVQRAGRPQSSSTESVSAETPPRIVGSRCGANFAVWRPGTSLPSAFAFANSDASTVPTRSWTEGTPAALPNTPKSSEPGEGLVVPTPPSAIPRF